MLPAIPTSKKLYQDKAHVIPKKVVVIICAPLVPTYRPNNPAIMEPNKGKNTRVSLDLRIFNSKKAVF